MLLVSDESSVNKTHGTRDRMTLRAGGLGRGHKIGPHGACDRMTLRACGCGRGHKKQMTLRVLDGL